MWYHFILFWRTLIFLMVLCLFWILCQKATWWTSGTYGLYCLRSWFFFPKKKTYLLFVLWVYQHKIVHIHPIILFFPIVLLMLWICSNSLSFSPDSSVCVSSWLGLLEGYQCQYFPWINFCFYFCIVCFYSLPISVTSLLCVFFVLLILDFIIVW